MLAALANATLLVSPLGGDWAIAARFATGALLAGVYPVGMKIAVGWGTRDRGLLVGLVVGALTLGNGAPYLSAFIGGAAWRPTILVISLLAGIGGLIVLAAGLGPLMPARRASIPARSGSPGPTGGFAAPISAISAICGNST